MSDASGRVCPAHACRRRTSRRSPASTSKAAEVTIDRSASRAAVSDSWIFRSRWTALAGPSLSGTRAPLTRPPRHGRRRRAAWHTWPPRRLGRSAGAACRSPRSARPGCPVRSAVGRLLRVRRRTLLATPLADRPRSSGGRGDGHTAGSVAGQEVHGGTASISGTGPRRRWTVPRFRYPATSADGSRPQSETTRRGAGRGYRLVPSPGSGTRRPRTAVTVTEQRTESRAPKLARSRRHRACAGRHDKWRCGTGP